MLYDNAIKELRRYVGEAFKAGTAVFPYYTLHGIEHLEELDRLAVLVGSVIPRLTEERLGLLRLALAVHDFAMVDVPDEARDAGEPEEQPGVAQSRISSGPARRPGKRRFEGSGATCRGGGSLSKRDARGPE